MIDPQQIALARQVIEQVVTRGAVMERILPNTVRTQQMHTFFPVAWVNITPGGQLWHQIAGSDEPVRGHEIAALAIDVDEGEVDVTTPDGMHLIIMPAWHPPHQQRLDDYARAVDPDSRPHHHAEGAAFYAGLPDHARSTARRADQ